MFELPEQCHRKLLREMAVAPLLYPSDDDDIPVGFSNLICDNNEAGRLAVEPCKRSPDDACPVPSLPWLQRVPPFKAARSPGATAARASSAGEGRNDSLAI